jgi:receptor protein-tyrosine kinase
MAASVDGVIIVARAGQTERKAVASVVNTLQRVRANVMGLVLNEITKDVSDTYHYYGNHGYYGRYSRYSRPES